MFPFYENTFEWDDFGEVINPDDYMRNDEDVDQASMQVIFVYYACILHAYLNFFCDTFSTIWFV